MSQDKGVSPSGSECCGVCLWWHRDGPKAAHEWIIRQRIEYSQLLGPTLPKFDLPLRHCRRFPKHEWTGAKHYCGEFTRDSDRSGEGRDAQRLGERSE